MIVNLAPQMQNMCTEGVNFNSDTTAILCSYHPHGVLGWLVCDMWLGYFLVILTCILKIILASKNMY